jgi:hypothetical protein
VGKGVIAAGEAVADILTLGIAEAAETPVEALASMKESESHADN